MVEFIKAFIAQYREDENEGQGLVEYALILVLISVFAIATMRLVGDGVVNVFNQVVSAL
jgi:pilus assembly protein Flp/PilA